jgi:outer membrane protein OmpA-like peptidoglycan-associated protein
MNFRNMALAAALVAVPATLQAQPVTGWYVGPGVGINQLMDMNNGNGAGRGTIESDVGLAVKGGVGYGFGNGLRLELEGNFRYQHSKAKNVNLAGGGDGYQYGPMVNLLYDFDIGNPSVYPFVGIGVGGQIMDISVGNRSSKSDMQAAAQGIVGLAFPLDCQLSITADARAMGYLGKVNFNPGKLDNPINVSGMIGLRYSFAECEQPRPVPAPKVEEARSYLVFFDWDKYDLSARARQIIADAAGAAQRQAVTRIDVAGHADKTGTAAYNQALSMRRAQAVAGELVRLGVKKEAISVEAFGFSKPLVPTAMGVREPQNRRVEIVLK